MTQARPGPFFGKYRGTVENNVDLTGKGRVQVSADVLAGKLAWATPCMPYAGPGVGFFAVPPVKASVWIEFESGDLNKPILAGCFWDGTQMPPTLPGPASIYKTVLKTDAFLLEANHMPGLSSLTIEMNVGGITGLASIKADPTGLTISGAGNTIVLSVDGVSINKTNLKVLK